METKGDMVANTGSARGTAVSVAEAYKIALSATAEGGGGAAMSTADRQTIASVRASTAARLSTANVMDYRKSITPGVGAGDDDDFIKDRDKPCFTLKAVVSGIFMGTINAFLMLYYGLKTGIMPSLNIIAGLGGFMVSRGPDAPRKPRAQTC